MCSTVREKHWIVDLIANLIISIAPFYLFEFINVVLEQAHHIREQGAIDIFCIPEHLSNDYIPVQHIDMVPKHDIIYSLLMVQILLDQSILIQ